MTGQMLFGAELWQWRIMNIPVTTTTAHCESVLESVLDSIGSVVVGKRRALALMLTVVLARDHILIENLPGLG